MHPWQKVLCGVPERSTVGPLHFLIYINHLRKAFVNLNITRFTGDTSLCFHVKPIGTIVSIVNFELKHPWIGCELTPYLWMYQNLSLFYFVPKKVG